MFKDVFTLKKSSYHAKMMKWIWNLECTDFTHMCPYWWLSVFNHMIFIPYFIIRKGGWLIKYLLVLLGHTIVLLWKLFEAPLSLVYDKWERRIDRLNAEREERRLEREAYWKEKRKKEREERIAYYKEHPEEIEEMSKKNSTLLEEIREWHWRDYLELTDKMHEIKNKIEQSEWAKKAEKRAKEAAEALSKIRQNFIRKYSGMDKNEILTTTPDERLEHILHQWEEKKKEESAQRERERMIAIKNRINSILRIVKPIVTSVAYALGSIVVIFAVYYIFKGTIATVHYISSIRHSTWQKMGKVGSTGGVILTGLGIIFLIGWGIFNAFMYIQDNNITIFPKRKRKYSYKVYTEKPESHFWENIFEAILNFFEWMGDNIFSPVWKFICKFCRIIKNAVYFIIQMLKANCPAIRWED